MPPFVRSFALLRPIFAEFLAGHYNVRLRASISGVLINYIDVSLIPRWVRHVSETSIARARSPARGLMTARQSFNVLETRPGAPVDVAINDNDDDDDDDNDDVDDNKSAQRDKVGAAIPRAREEKNTHSLGLGVSRWHEKYLSITRVTLSLFLSLSRITQIYREKSSYTTKRMRIRISSLRLDGATSET